MSPQYKYTMESLRENDPESDGTHKPINLTIIARSETEALSKARKSISLFEDEPYCNIHISRVDELE